MCVTDDGRIRIENGDVVKSPSVVAIRSQQLREGSVVSRNGWRYWRVMEDGQPGAMLDELRFRMALDGRSTEGAEEGICELRASFWVGMCVSLDVTDPETWGDAYEWLVRRAWELRQAFA